jgi:hypothetical protein
MPARTTAVAKTFSCNNDEVRPLALVYIKTFKDSPAELAAFTAKDPSVNAAWLTQFETDNDELTKIVSSATIKKENSDLTLGIKEASKRCVEYGTELSYWLPKAFPNNPGTVASFGVVEANNKMRSGDTEGTIDKVRNVVNTIIKNQVQLQTTAWPVANLANYESLLTTVEALNTEQENNKKLVPENTDSSTTLRNKVYSYIQTILQLNDIVHKNTNPQKHKSYQLATLRKQITVSIKPKTDASKKPTPPVE